MHPCSSPYAPVSTRFQKLSTCHPLSQLLGLNCLQSLFLPSRINMSLLALPLPLHLLLPFVFLFVGFRTDLLRCPSLESSYARWRFLFYELVSNVFDASQIWVWDSSTKSAW